MSGDNQDKKDAGSDPPLAITFPSKRENVAVDRNVKQPAQPTSLQGLLKYAMEVSEGENATQNSHFTPMDEERKKFLEGALAGMTTDVIKVLQEQIKILENADQLNDGADIGSHKNAFTIILEYVDHIDIANDFHKIGGFTIFNPCFKSVHWEIRAEACNVLAELCQNNPYCQKVVLDNSFVSLLLNMLESDESIQVCIKALYALGCIVRQNRDGFHQLINYQGLTVLAKTLQRDDDKLRTKTAFLLGSLCSSEPDLKNRLVFLEYIPTLIDLIAQPRRASHEHLLSLLCNLVEDNNVAITECRNPKYNLQNILVDHRQLIKDKEECLEEDDCCKKLLTVLFQGDGRD